MSPEQFVAGQRLMSTAARPNRVLPLVLGTLLSLPLALPALDGDSPKPTSKVLYVLPNYLDYQSVSDSTFTAEVAQLRQRLGEGRYVRVGFTVYIVVSMDSWQVNPSDRTAVRQALSTTIAQIDKAISRAQANNIPICLSLLTATREHYDPVQRDAERDDRRNTSWYMDNGLANGWVTHSRYARKFQTVQEAYIRELGRVLADRMRRYAATLVAASGDGEVELSFDRSAPPVYTESTAQLADYSPFAIAEFRDWLRNGGMYGSGQPLAGQGYANGGRYAGDASPAVDTNGDRHTLNGDFGTGFSSWDLRYFDWSLSDSIEGDPHAIPAMIYAAPGWNPSPDAGGSRFDAPRVRLRGTAWWEVWDLFRQTMVWRHNVDFARWITTSPDDSGAVVPTSRWYSDQIPADYLFGGSPDDPNFRLVTSASPHWTADITPYGGLGITAFNVYFGDYNWVYTARNVAPIINQRGVRWGILEWHPSVPVSEHLAVYDEEMRVIEQYRPSLLVPIYWGHPYYQIQNTGFELALRNLISRLKDGPPPMTTAVPVVAPHFLKPGERPPFRLPGPSAVRRLDPR